MAQTEARAPVVEQGNGSTTVFSIPWAYDNAADVRVALIDQATGAETYQASPAITISPPAANPRTVTFAVAPPAGVDVTIWPNDPGRQTVGFNDLDRFPAHSIGLMGDRAARQAEANFQKGQRALRRPMNETGEMVIPGAAARAGRVLAFGPSGDGAKPIGGPLMTDLDALGARIAALDALSTTDRLAAMDAILADFVGPDTIGDAAALLAVAAPGLVAKDSAGTPVARTLEANDGLAWDHPAGAAGNPKVRLVTAGDAALIELGASVTGRALLKQNPPATQGYQVLNTDGSVGTQPTAGAGLGDVVAAADNHFTGVNAGGNARSLAALKARSVVGLTAGASVLLTDGTRSGMCELVLSDVSAQVTADPLESTWVAFNSDPTGASGAWRRRLGDATYQGHFGITSSAVTLGPTDPWQSIIETWRGSGEIILEDGVYTISDVLRIGPGVGRLTISAQNLGDAKIVGQWEINVSEVKWRGVDLEPPETDRLIRADLCSLTFEDVVCDANDIKFTGSGLGLFFNCEVTFSSRDRVCTFDAGVGIGEAFDFDKSTVKLVGNVTANRVRFINRNATTLGTKQLIILDQSKLLLAGAELVSLGAVTAGRLIDARRRSDAVFQDTDNLVEGGNDALIARQGSVIVLSGLLLKNNRRATSRRSGGLIYDDPATVTYEGSTVTNNFTDLAEARLPGGFYGHAPHVITFSTGGVNLPADATNFIAPAHFSASAPPARMQIPFAGVLKNLRGYASGGAGTGESIVFTVQTGGVDRAIVATLGSDIAFEDLVNTYNITEAGSHITIKAVSSEGATPRSVTLTLELERT